MGGGPQDPLPPGGGCWHKAGSATKLGTHRPGTLLPPPGRLAPRKGKGGHGWGGCAGHIPAARTPPSHVRAPQGAHPGLPGWVQGGERWRWETGGAQEAPGERVGTGVAWGGMGRGPRTPVHTHTREGLGILNCIADKSPTYIS